MAVRRRRSAGSTPAGTAGDTLSLYRGDAQSAAPAENHTRSPAVDFLADELAQSLADSGIPEVTVTCMPMSKEKLRRRGYTMLSCWQRRWQSGWAAALTESCWNTMAGSPISIPFPGRNGKNMPVHRCVRAGATRRGRLCCWWTTSAPPATVLRRQHQCCGSGAPCRVITAAAAHYPGGLSGNASQLDPRLKSGYTGQSKQK